MDTMASVFTKMVDSTSAFSQPSVKSQDGPESAMKESQDSSNSLGTSPGKMIDYQSKLLSQIDLAHWMFECGAITTELKSEDRCYLIS